MNDKEKENVMICRCEEVRLNTIEQVIEEGFDTIDSIKRATRAGMGLCQGRTCQQLVTRILRNKTGKPLEEIVPATYRPPFRPVKLDIIAEEGERVLKGRG